MNNLEKAARAYFLFDNPWYRDDDWETYPLKCKNHYIKCLEIATQELTDKDLPPQNRKLLLIEKHKNKRLLKK